MAVNNSGPRHYEVVIDDIKAMILRGGTETGEKIL